MTLHTDRLRLEPLSERHAAAMLAVLQDDRLYAYIPDVRYPSLDALEARYRRLARGSASIDEIWWNFIVFLQGSATPMGFVQATLMPRQRLAEVAYVLSPQHWGRGYATEAVGSMIEEIARRVDIDTARARIDQRNLASIAVVKRLGFACVGTVVEDGSTDGRFERALRNAPGMPGPTP